MVLHHVVRYCEVSHGVASWRGEALRGGVWY